MGRFSFNRAMRAGGSGEKTPQRWGGRVLETGGGIYRVEVDGQGEIEASLRGRLKQVARTGDRVVPGDLVVVSVEEPSGGWTIEDVEGRQNQLVRASAGGRKAKVVAANLQRVVVVFSACEPPFDLAAADSVPGSRRGLQDSPGTDLEQDGPAGSSNGRRAAVDGLRRYGLYRAADVCPDWRRSRAP